MIIKKRLITFLLAFASVLPATAATTYNATRASVDRIVGPLRDASAPASGYTIGTTSNLVGGTGSSSAATRYTQNLLYRYDLPDLAAGQSLESFSFSFQIATLRDYRNNDIELDVYLLDASNPASSGITHFYHGPDDTANHPLVGSKYIKADSNANETVSAVDGSVTFTINSGGALTLLQSFYGGDHIAEQQATFRFNIDEEVTSTSDVYQRYYLDNQESGLAVAAVAAVPEPSSTALLGLGGLALMLRRRR